MPYPQAEHTRSSLRGRTRPRSTARPSGGGCTPVGVCLTSAPPVPGSILGARRTSKRQRAASPTAASEEPRPRRAAAHHPDRV